MNIKTTLFRQFFLMKLLIALVIMSVTKNANAADYEISNVTFSQQDYSVLLPNENISVTFKYKAVGGNININAIPYFNGMPAANATGTTAIKYVDPTGTGTDTFSLSLPGEIDSVLFTIYNSDNSELLFEKFLAVNYSFKNYDIVHANISPPYDAIVEHNAKIRVDYHYIIKEENIRIDVRPVGEMDLHPAGPSFPYSRPYGASVDEFFVTSEGMIHGVHFIFWNATNDTILYDEFVPLNFRIQFDIVQNINIANTNSTDLLNVYPVPASDFITVEKSIASEMKYSIVDIYGKEVLNGILSDVENKLAIDNLTSGYYVFKATDGQSTFEKSVLVK